MSVNPYRPHVMVLPEDDANREVAIGFQQDLLPTVHRQLQVLRVAGGWRNVLDQFHAVHAREMIIWPERLMVLLIDLDGHEERLEKTKAEIPTHLNERVFILGAWIEPEDLTKAGLGSHEAIGKALAKDCREETANTWGHRLLKHNASEVNRLREIARPILFPPL